MRYAYQAIAQHSGKDAGLLGLFKHRDGAGTQGYRETIRVKRVRVDDETWARAWDSASPTPPTPFAVPPPSPLTKTVTHSCGHEESLSIERGQPLMDWLGGEKVKAEQSLCPACQRVFQEKEEAYKAREPEREAARKAKMGATPKTTGSRSWHGAFIRAIREKKGMTQVMMAERLTEAMGRPVKQSEISRWEAGDRIPQAATLRMIEQVLGQKLDIPSEEERAQKHEK